MKILLVEDDPLQANQFARELKGTFDDAEVEQIYTEKDFRDRFDEIARKSFDLIVVDVMLPWTQATPDMKEAPEEVQQQGFSKAGFRCARMLVENERTRRIQIIIHSVMELSDPKIELAPLSPTNLYYLRKSSRVKLSAFARNIRIASMPSATVRQKVFVVHGHDGEAKQAVARFISDLGMSPVILNEQVNRGNTIIEKFEGNSDVAFAVVLLTPDDVGAATASRQTLAPRARQNVIFELGFFIARLGRDKVCALSRGGVEIPSDYSGMILVEMDAGGGWRMRLAKEMQDAGLRVDMNQIL